MQLTKFSDYAIRVLIYVESADPKLITIDEITKAYGISRAHLMKVVNSLTQNGFLTAVRGRNGGIKLGRPPNEINLAEVLTTTEPNFSFVECMGGNNTCSITPNCKFKQIMFKARTDFLNSMASYTLADITVNKTAFNFITQE